MTYRFVTCALLFSALGAAPPATAPVKVPVTRRAVVPDPISEEFRQKLGAYSKLVPTAAALRDPAERARVSVEAIPLVTRIIELEQAIVAKQPASAGLYLSIELKYVADLLVLGGDVAAAKVSPENLAKSKLIAEYITGAPDRQAAIAEDAVGTLKSDPLDQKLFMFAATLKNSAGVASPELTKSLAQALTDSMAAMSDKRIAEAKEKVEKSATGGFVGKPIVLAGQTPDGKPLTTASLKGKVVLVDFWATWCVPCKAGLPHVKEIYKTYHDKGLEIVGISNDVGTAPLTKYLEENPDMPWAQLFDPAAAADRKWHPICEKYGIASIPAMFLIDRNGVCRSVTARWDMDKLIPELLAESPTAK